MTEYSRIILKRSLTPGVTPTVPEIDNLNQFIGTDIFEGELFFNIPDGKLYTRANGEIILLNDSETFTKVYPIGPWNMGSGDKFVSISPEMDAANVVSISVSVRSDDGDVYWTNFSDLVVVEFDAGNVRIRASRSLTDETSTSFNRGWVRVEFRKII
jgi:outer membrane protein assembly factor BamB